MDIGNFLEKHWLEIIFAVIAAILVPLFWEPIKKFFVSIFKLIRNLSASKKFEQNYREWLINKYKFLNVRGIKTNAPVAIELEKVFVSLKAKRPAAEMMRLRIAEEYGIDDDGEFKAFDSDESSAEEFMETRMQEYETERVYDLNDLFSLRGKRFIIIGAPGSGKTTLLNYLALKFSRKTAEELFGIENEILPIFINLRDTMKEGFLDVKDFVENYNNYIELPHSPPEDFFERRLEQGKCIFLLDGLDEVAKEEERKRVAKWLDNLASTYCRNIFIATSRPYGYETARLYNDFFELHILNFTPEQVQEFIRYWTKAVEIKAREDESDFTLKEAEKKADDLLKAIKENPGIEVLTVNPLLLTIVSLVHRYRAALPKRRVELYEECCDVLLFYWDTAKGIAGELRPGQKRAILQPLAFHLQREGIREQKREKFIELLENGLPKIGVRKDKAEDLIDEIRDRCGILVETKIGFFGFTHLTFQEFLTARYISDNDLEDFLLTKKRDESWLEVTLLYSGMKDTTNLFQKILNEKEDIFYTNLFLIGRCLAESLSLDPELRTQIEQKLFDVYLDENEFNESKQSALEILTEINYPQTTSRFIERTKDKRSDVRGHAALALGRIRAKEGVLPLIELLKDTDSRVRASAASALGDIRAKEAIVPLIELLKDRQTRVRGTAASALGNIPAKEAILPLIKLLKDKQSYVRGSAASALGQIRAEEAASPLIELLKDRKSLVSERASSALGQIRAKETIPALIQLLKDKERHVRGSAASALGKFGAKQAISPLINLLNSKESHIRWSAAYALGHLRAKEALSPLLEFVKHRETEVRGRAASVLGQIGAKEAVSTLLPLLNDNNTYVRARAVSALGQIQAEEAVPALLQLLKDQNSHIRARAASALAHIQARDAVSPLIELLTDEASLVRERAASALGNIQAKEAVSPLIELLKYEVSGVRRRAVYALGQIGDEKAIRSLKQLLNDRQISIYRNVRHYAFNALKNISETTGIPIYKD
jgi:HEAT repeat protein/energy-coupling factor transporter ATP-binding protein EcfA2